jgi:hypothetical protein
MLDTGCWMIPFSIQQADSGGDWQVGKLKIQHRFRQQIFEANRFGLWRGALNHNPSNRLPNPVTNSALHLSLRQKVLPI